MGLGKTVELLACIFVHRKPGSGNEILLNNALEAAQGQRSNLKRLKRDHVECICGAVSESSQYKGLWVQCDVCDAWQHADCVGYSPKEDTSKSKGNSNGQGSKKNPMENSKKQRGKENKANIVMMDGEHICQLCFELIQATDAPAATGATLIVCPAPILPQWHAEIIRYNPYSCFTVLQHLQVVEPSIIMLEWLLCHILLCILLIEILITYKLSTISRLGLVSIYFLHSFYIDLRCL